MEVEPGALPVGAADTDVVSGCSSDAQDPFTTGPYGGVVEPSADLPSDRGRRFNGHAATLADDRASLEAQLAAARERVRAAQERGRQREVEARAAMRAEVELARQQIAQLEAQHRATVELIENAANLEIAQVHPGLVMIPGPQSVGDAVISLPSEAVAGQATLATSGIGGFELAEILVLGKDSDGAAGSAD